MSTIATKRANFDLTPEQDEILANLRAALSASSVKDTVLRAAQLKASTPTRPRREAAGR